MNDFKAKQSEGGGLWRWESTWFIRGRRTLAYNASITTRLLRVAPGGLPQAHLVFPGDTPHRNSFGLQPAFYYRLSGDTLRAPLFCSCLHQRVSPILLPLVEWAPEERGNGSWPGPTRLRSRWRKSMSVLPSSSGPVKEIVALTDMRWPEWLNHAT